MGWQDMGDYKCVAENEQGTAEKTVKVDVAGNVLLPPSVLSFQWLFGINGHIHSSEERKTEEIKGKKSERR